MSNVMTNLVKVVCQSLPESTFGWCFSRIFTRLMTFNRYSYREKILTRSKIYSPSISLEDKGKDERWLSTSTINNQYPRHRKRVHIRLFDGPWY